MIFDHLYRGMHEPELKIIDIFVANFEKNLPGRPAEFITSKLCGAAAMCFGIRPSPHGIATSNRKHDPVYGVRLLQAK